MGVCALLPLCATANYRDRDKNSKKIKKKREIYTSCPRDTVISVLFVIPGVRRSRNIASEASLSPVIPRFSLSRRRGNAPSSFVTPQRGSIVSLPTRRGSVESAEMRDQTKFRDNSPLKVVSRPGESRKVQGNR